MNTTSCDYDTQILNNKFFGWGLNLLPGRSTQALELHGLKELVQDNTIQGYPNDVILARSVRDLTVNRNTIQQNGWVVGNTDSAIDIWNQAGNRRTTSVTISNNTISNSLVPPATVPASLRYGIRIYQHQCLTISWFFHIRP